MLTIYDPMIYMAPYVMCLMGANPLQGPWKGWAQKSRNFHGPTLLMAQVMDFSHQTHYIQGRINQRSIGNFMYMRGSGPIPHPLQGSSVVRL